jgi:hypothetical protein
MRLLDGTRSARRSIADDLLGGREDTDVDRGEPLLGGEPFVYRDLGPAAPANALGDGRPDERPVLSRSW